MFPPVIESYNSVLLYALLLFVIIYGGFHYLKQDKNQLPKAGSVLLWSGLFSFTIGLLGMFTRYYQTFDLFDQVGDVSPQIVATGIKSALVYPILGFFILALVFLFRLVFSLKRKNNI